MKSHRTRLCRPLLRLHSEGLNGQVPSSGQWCEFRRRRETGHEHHVLEQFPKVDFIGHAQGWWGNIDLNHDQETLYPTTAGLLGLCGCVLWLAGCAAPEAPVYPDKRDLLHYLDRQGRPHPIESRTHWDIRRIHTLQNMQKAMGPLPRLPDDPLEVQVLETERLPQVERRKITFVSQVVEGNPDRLPAYLLIPDGLPAEQTAPAVLCLHQTTAIGKAEPAGVGGKADLHYALELARRGYVTLAPDYPGFGDYKIDPYAMGYASATMKGILNHRRAIALLQSLPQVDPDRIGVIGHSLGGHNALFLSAFEPRVRAVATSCGFNAFRHYFGGDLKGWSHRGYMPRIAQLYGSDAARMPFDFTEVLGVLAPRPVFISAPEGDHNFAVGRGQGMR